MAKRPAPEISFQEHIVRYLGQRHGYAFLEQDEITDREHYIAEDHLWAFLTATQKETLDVLAEQYGSDTRNEVFRALRKELAHTPLWLLLRNGLPVKGQHLHLYYPKPRSSESVANKHYGQNRITVRHHLYFGASNEEVDLGLFLNGLPIVLLELKHEKNQTVHDAVEQFTRRDHGVKLFQHPFLYLAADTSDVMAATDPKRVENFRWHNSGVTNTAQTKGEYPVEFLYRDVFSQEQLLEALSFFLVRVPKREAKDDVPERPAFTLYPRFHQSRMVRKVSADLVGHFAEKGDVGRKYLINHSAGSGKTLSICWLADRLHSLYKPGTSQKLLDLVFVLTDRKSLDTNVKDDLVNFTHLKDVVGMAERAEDVNAFVRKRKAIIVTTQQKLDWILEKLLQDPALKQLRVAFLIDEAHRSQEGRMGEAIRLPFRDREQPDEEAPEEDEEDRLARVIREHDANQLFVAFTATPSRATQQLFGDPFDIYTEEEAIQEGYIVDVASSIISYKTLYNLDSSKLKREDLEKQYPAGVLSKALKNAAFLDDGLIQFKAEVMLRIFEEQVMPLIDGRAKAMIVTSSRPAGLRYFRVIQEKLRERAATYKALFAFSDFVDPTTNEVVTEHAINGLADGELIENRFKGDDYRLMVVANKFQTGFDQPLLAGMFLDKPVVDRNAVQTVSRLNRKCDHKDSVVVVDFTNNAKSILKAFNKYRKGSPHPTEEPDEKVCIDLYKQIIAAGVFTDADAQHIVELLANSTDAQLQYATSVLRIRFEEKLPVLEARKEHVRLLERFSTSFRFLSRFFTYAVELQRMDAFVEWVAPQLIKQGTASEMMALVRKMEVVKAAVQYQGEVQATGGTVKLTPKPKRQGGPAPVKKVSIAEMIDDIRNTYPISEEEALYIKEVTEETAANEELATTAKAHTHDEVFLKGAFKMQVSRRVQQAYDDRGRYDELTDPKYIEPGAIFDIMAHTVIGLQLAS